MQANTLLRKYQYQYDELHLARYIVINKIANQRAALMKIRKKTPGTKEAIEGLLQDVISHRFFQIQCGNPENHV